MFEHMEKYTLNQKQIEKLPPYLLNLDFETFSNHKRLLRNKVIFNYKGINLGFSEKQALVLRLIANGFSNSKIACELNIKESTVKILVYRVMRYMEAILLEDIDRFSLVIIAQGLQELSIEEVEEIKSLLD